MKSAPGTTKEWIATSVALLAGLFPTAFFLLFGSFIAPLYFLYHLAFSVFPQLCPAALPLGDCYAVGGWWRYWSLPLWLGVAAIFGYLAQGQSLRSKTIWGVTTIAGTIGTMQLTIFLLGLRQYVDAL